MERLKVITEFIVSLLWPGIILTLVKSRFEKTIRSARILPQILPANVGHTTPPLRQAGAFHPPSTVKTWCRRGPVQDKLRRLRPLKGWLSA